MPSVNILVKHQRKTQLLTLVVMATMLGGRFRFFPARRQKKADLNSSLVAGFWYLVPGTSFPLPAEPLAKVRLSGFTLHLPPSPGRY